MRPKQHSIIDACQVAGPSRIESLCGESRRIRGILRPHGVEDIVLLVKHARNVKGIKLYPVSCGRNWGFGSFLPPLNDQYILDLSELNRIRVLDLRCGRVEVEAGVTQQLLDQKLAEEGRTFYFNVTGAGNGASLVGNALERGIGYFGSRNEDLLELEVVLGDGSLVRTSRIASVQAGRYAGGIGPGVRELFCQSSLGIVTAATIQLHRRPELMGGVVAKLRSAAEIGRLISRVAEIKSELHLLGIPHIGNKERLVTTMAPYLSEKEFSDYNKQSSAWTALIPVSGPKPIFLATIDHIKGRLSELADCSLIGGEGPPQFRSDNLNPNIKLELLTQGMPSDIALPGVTYAALRRRRLESASNLDAGDAGLIHLTPCCATEPKEILHLLKTIFDARRKYHNNDLPITINVLNPNISVFVLSIPFRRRDREDSNDAKSFAEELTRTVCSSGHLPYRSAISYQKLLPKTNIRWKQFEKVLKQHFDPDYVISFSKYDWSWTNCLDPVSAPPIEQDALIKADKNSMLVGAQ